MVTYTHISTPSCVEICPDTAPVGSVIWLHGLGADGYDFVSLVPQLNLPDTLPLRFIFPHAPFKPITINNGYVMRAWFDIYSLQLNQRIDEEGIAASVESLQQFIKNEQDKNIPSEKIILGGFSQGALIALMAGLRCPHRLAGILALSGFLPNAEQVVALRNQANQAIPIFLAHGTEDTIVPYTLGQATAHALQKHSMPVTWHSYAIAHSLCTQEVSDISAWLIKQIG